MHYVNGHSAVPVANGHNTVISRKQQFPLEQGGERAALIRYLPTLHSGTCMLNVILELTNITIPEITIQYAQVPKHFQV